MDANDLKRVYRHFDGRQNVTERELYTFFTAQDTRIVEHKKKIAQIVAERGLASFMNDTKWLALQAEILNLPFPPAYTEKLITDRSPPVHFAYHQLPGYCGNWSPFYEEGLPLFFTIEWMRIYPRRSQNRGRLVTPEVEDQTGTVIAILAKLNIPFEEEEGTIIIWGYR